MNEKKRSNEKQNKNSKQNGKPETPYSQFDIIPLISNSNFQEMQRILSNLEISLSSSSFPKTIKKWNYILINHILFNTDKTFDSIQNFLQKDENESNNSIQKLNKIILYYKTGKFRKMIHEYVNDNESNSNSYIFEINSLLCILDTCLMFNDPCTSRVILSILESKIPNQITEKNNNNIDEILFPYLTQIECFHQQNTNFTEILLLYKSQIHLCENNWEKERKNLDDYKIIFISSQNKIKFPLYNRMKEIYNMLKIRVDYLTNSSTKFIKHLNSFKLKNEKDEQAKLYYYHSLGVLFFKNKKIEIAKYYFNICYQIVSQNAELKVRFFERIYYNYALCLFFEKNFKKSYKIFKFLIHKELFQFYPFIYYRIGICLLEMIISIKDKNTNSIRVSLNLKKIFLSSQNSQNKEKIKEAIKMFKTTINLISNNSKYLSLYFQELNPYLTSSIPKNNGVGSNNFVNKSNKQKKINEQNNHSLNQIAQSSNFTSSFHFKSFYDIYIQSYLNLLFTLLLNQSYTEVIFYANKLTSDKSKINTQKQITQEVQYAIDNYLIQSYLFLNKPEMALEIIKKSRFIPNKFGSFYNMYTHTIQTDLSYKISLCVNVIRLNFSLNKTNEIVRGINQLIKLVNSSQDNSSVNTNGNNYPEYVNNIILYYLLSLKKRELAINFITNQQVPSIFLKEEDLK